MSSCPGEGTLRFIGTDALSNAAYLAIEQHVEGCPECKAVLERLAHRRTAPRSASPGPDRWPRIPGFEIQSELGRGAMGVVYLAIETGLDRPVALKILPGAQGPDAGPRRRWLREARAVSSVRHPNVVPLYDYGEADGWFFLVLEYIPGGTLKKRLAEPLPPWVAARLVETIARAVGYIHSRGLLHLDLKPSNILLDREGNGSWDRVTPRISDFGLAHSDGDSGTSQTSLAGLRGTPSYMAPEQATASPAGVGAATDIHALGAILYELLTGRPPFHGASTLETLDQVRGQNPVPPRRLNPKIPRDLETISLKCLEKNPPRRYASAKALADDLDRFLAGRPIQARPVSPIEHAWRGCRRQPVIAALAVTLFLTVIGSFLGLLELLRRSETLRSLSEANYRVSEANHRVASRSLDEIVRILFDSPVDFRFIDPGHKVKESLEIARSQDIELSKQHPPDAGSLKRLAMIDQYLATFSMRDGKPEEARSLMEECIRSYESSLALAPGDMEIQRKEFDAAAWMASSFSDSKSDRLYELWNARALAALEPLRTHETVHAYGVSGLSRAHRLYADSLLMWHGQTDRARKELEEDLAFVRSDLVAETRFPEIVLSEALTLAALGRWSGEFTLLRSPIRSQPSYFSIPGLERDLGELAARRIGWLSSIVSSPCLIPDDLPTETWVDRVIASMKGDAAEFHIDGKRIPEIAWWLGVPAAIALVHQRHVGNLGDAERHADRLVALAERLTRSYPDQAAVHMLLSEGYVQKAKNAYRKDEELVIKGWEQKALTAAAQAATLDPDNDQARNLVKIRRARLAKIALK